VKAIKPFAPTIQKVKEIVPNKIIPRLEPALMTPAKNLARLETYRPLSRYHQEWNHPAFPWSNGMRTSLVCVFLMALGLAPITRSYSADEKAKAVEKPAITFSLLDLNGKTHSLDQNDAKRVRAFVFLSTECPVANGYLKTLNELNTKFPNRLEFYGVVSDPSVTRTQAAKHFTEYKATFPVLFDASGLLATALKPSHVPQAFLLDRDGRLVYRGAIDNAWEAIGRRRPKAEKHYLADAIAAAVDGKAVAISETTPVGCLVETPPTKGEKAKVTYARDIAPIIQARCLNCHREGQAAPFTLADYDQTAKRAKQIVRVTQDRLMPPWIPVPTGHDKFVGERWLTDRELDLLKTWAETGRAKGVDDDLPPAPTFAEGWRQGKPD